MKEVKSNTGTSMDSVESVSSLSDLDLNDDVVSEKASLAADDNESVGAASTDTASTAGGGWPSDAAANKLLVLRLEWPNDDFKVFEHVPLDQQEISRKKYTGQNLIFDSHCHLDRVFARLFPGESNTDFYCEKKSSKKSPKGSNGPLTVLRNKFRFMGFDDSFEGCINIICHPKYFSKRYWEWMCNDQGLYFAIGCHPQSASCYDPFSEFDLEQAMKHPKVVAVGECGLDDKWADSNDNIFACQQDVFRRHVVVAMKFNKPLVLHIRGLNAAHAAMNIMEYVGLPNNWPIHMHAFTDSWAECHEWTKRFPGMKFGLIGDFFDYQIAQNLPLDKILLETDAPYFLPNKIKSSVISRKVSVPGDVWFVAQQVAYWKKIKVNEVLEANRRNISDIYGIPPYSPFPPGLKAVPPTDVTAEITDDNDTVPAEDRIYACAGSFAVQRGERP